MLTLPQCSNEYLFRYSINPSARSKQPWGAADAPIAERVGRTRYVRFKGGLSPRDRRMDHSRNIPAKARTAPAIAYINMFTDKPIATSEVPKKIIQIAPIIHTIRHHQC